MYPELFDSERRGSGASQEVYVDLDHEGRSGPWDGMTPTMDLDTQRRQDALTKLGAISRRRSLVHVGDFVAPDLCGRGDPRVFAEISRRVSLVDDGRLHDQDLEAIASAHHHHHHRHANGNGDDDEIDGDEDDVVDTSPNDAAKLRQSRRFRSPLRRSISTRWRSTPRSAFFGVRRLFGFSRQPDKSSSS